jgi:hypothetical protein
MDERHIRIGSWYEWDSSKTRDENIKAWAEYCKIRGIDFNIDACNLQAKKIDNERNKIIDEILDEITKEYL